MVENIDKLKSIFVSASKRTKKKKWPCFFPRCDMLAIESHSQTRSASLAHIQEQGHVIGRKFSPLPKRSFQLWEPIGIGKASVFKGFCGNHDDKLFKQADSISEKNLTKKALSSLAYRTFAMEMRKKEFYADLTARVLGRMDDTHDVPLLEYLDGFKAGLINCIKVTKPYYVAQFGNLRTGNNSPLLIHNVYKFNQNLSISCSSMINPTPILAQPLDEPQPTVLFNILPRKKYTLVIFSCFQDDLVLLDAFLKQFYRLEDLVFNFCEEILFNITFFKSLDKELLETIDEAQEPWTTWQPTEVPDIFKVSITENSLFRTL